MTVPIVGIDYEEYAPETYAGCYFSIGNAHFTVDSGNPDQDFSTISRLLWVLFGGLAYMTMLSSSVDHFIMDGGDLSTSLEVTNVGHAD